MADKRPKAMVVAQKEVRNFFKTRFPEWDFFGESSDVNDFWREVDNETLPTDLNVIITTDWAFNPSAPADEQENFRDFVQTATENSFFVMAVYKEAEESVLKNRCAKINEDSPSKNDEKVYFISKSDVTTGLRKALNDYINESSNKENIAVLEGSDIYSRSVSDSDEDRHGKIFAFTSSKGGAGKSTVALTTSTYIAHSSLNSYRNKLEDHPLKVIVVDFDVRDSQMGFFIGKTSPNIVGLLYPEDLSDAALESVIIHDDTLMVDFILSPSKPSNADFIEYDFALRLLEKLRKKYDVIILDTGIRWDTELYMKGLYPAADHIIYVSEMTTSTRKSMGRWMKEVSEPSAANVEKYGQGIPLSKVSIVVNKALPDAGVSFEEIREEANGLKIVSAISSIPSLVTRCTNEHNLYKLLGNKVLRGSYRAISTSLLGNDYKLSEDVSS